MSKRQFIFFLIVLICLLPLAIAISWPNNHAFLIACNVGQGDAILITQGNTQILIDGGPNNQVLDCLSHNMPFYDKTIELVVNTHPEKDHLTGLLAVLDRYQVKLLLANRAAADSEVFKAVFQKVKDKNIAVFSPQKGDVIKVANMELDTLWPEKNWLASKGITSDIWHDTPMANATIAQTNTNVLGESTITEGLNEFSLVFHFKKANFDAIFTGDIDQTIEKQIIADQKFQNIEMLKIAHHGSKYSSSEEFLKAIKPQTAIVSVGKNSYGHPTQEIIDRLNQLGIKLLRTDKEKIKLSI